MTGWAEGSYGAFTLSGAASFLALEMLESVRAVEKGGGGCGGGPGGTDEGSPRRASWPARPPRVSIGKMGEEFKTAMTHPLEEVIAGGDRFTAGCGRRWQGSLFIAEERVGGSRPRRTHAYVREAADWRADAMRPTARRAMTQEKKRPGGGLALRLVAQIREALRRLTTADVQGIDAESSRAGGEAQMRGHRSNEPCKSTDTLKCAHARGFIVDAMRGGVRNER